MGFFSLKPVTPIDELDIKPEPTEEELAEADRLDSEARNERHRQTRSNVVPMSAFFSGHAFETSERTPADGPSYGELKDKLFALGYAAVPVSLGDSQPRGPWKLERLSYGAQYDDSGVGVLLDAPPATNAYIEYPRDFCIATIEIRTTDAVLRQRTWEIITDVLPGLKNSPMRIGSDGSRLMPVQVESGARVGELVSGDGLTVEIVSGIDCVVVAGRDTRGEPYRWERKFFDTHRDELPAINPRIAAAIARGVQAFVDESWVAPEWLRHKGSIFK